MLVAEVAMDPVVLMVVVIFRFLVVTMASAGPRQFWRTWSP